MKTGKQIKVIQEIKTAIVKKWDQTLCRGLKQLQIEWKADGTPVTEMDYFISELVKKSFADTYPDLHFLSEEDPCTFKFPVLVLDPVDGTRELIRGNPEWAISLAILYSPQLDDPRNFAWIFNPASGFELGEIAPSHPSSSSTDDSSHSILQGLISHTEWPYIKKDVTPSIQLQPCGSIAFKLGRMSRGECDFVFSKRPKSLWDIAAGSLLARWRGFSFWQGKCKVEKLNQIRWSGPFLWTKPKHYAALEGEVWDKW